MLYHSATLVSVVVWPVDGAFLVHERVRVDCAVTWQGHPVLAQKLAVGKRRVSSDASFWPGVVKVEEVEVVDISRGELCSLDVHAIKESSSFVHGCDVGAAHVRKTVFGLLTRVFPSVKLYHSHNI